MKKEGIEKLKKDVFLKSEQTMIVKEEKPILTSIKKEKNSKKIDDGGSPFPSHSKPSYDDCRDVLESLEALHGIKEMQNSVRYFL